MRFRSAAPWSPPGLLLLAGLLSACSDATVQPPTDGRLALGTWGSDSAAVIVTDSAVHVHIGCTFGDMPGTVMLDATGRFTRDGRYVLRAFPVQQGPSLPARFRGRVVGRTVTIEVTVSDTVAGRMVELGPVAAVLGREPGLVACPVCRVIPSRRRVPSMP